MKLDARLLVGEVIVIMRDKEIETLPVHENDIEIGMISYGELIKFLGDPDDEANVYFHKLNFNLGTVLHILRDRREVKVQKSWSLKDQSKDIIIWITRFAAAAVLAIAVIGVSWAIYKKYEDRADSKNLDTLAVADEMIALKTTYGETKKVKLSDSSFVWLNAASNLQYPASFDGLKNREIFLDGEAYIEPKTNKVQPFVIKTNKQAILASGARLNVSAYGKEKPMVLQGNEFNLQSADVNAALAWTKGDFLFHKQPLGQVMRELERWYGVSVVYQDEHMSDMLIGASISRTKTLDEVLKVIALTQHVHFNIIGKQVVVSK